MKNTKEKDHHKTKVDRIFVREKGTRGEVVVNSAWPGLTCLWWDWFNVLLKID